MPMMRNFKWSNSEKIIARQAYDRAYDRECTDILNKTKEILTAIKDPKDIWRVENYLNERGLEVEQKYDYRYSVLIVVLGNLMRDGYIKDSDLQGLDQDKIDAIRQIGH